MTATALDPGEDPHGSPWARRVVLVTLSLGLLVIVGAVFLRVIAARVPEQRATLEKLIADRTGLAVRFDNVHFAWGLDGTSAVFERVELTDPARGRVRVVAPELRVEFDTWDFLKHQQFTLGHVKLASPDIEIIGDPEAAAGAAAPRRTARAEGDGADVDEATAIRRYVNWAELMPIGRIEVEGARVHLLRRGDRAPRHSFTLSQANVSRGANTLNAFGTLQLSQDIGQSLFVSAKLDNLGAAAGVNGEVRLIARRLLLDKLAADFSRGRGTVDATLELRDGLVHTARLQASAREFEFTRGARFDHFTVRAALRREQRDVLLDFTDLQVTRGATLERAPRLATRLMLAPASTRVARTSLEAERLPFMAAELITALLAPSLERHLGALPPDWKPSAGELRSVRFESGGRFEAVLTGAEFTRLDDRARIANLAATVAFEDETLTLSFDPSNEATVSMPEASEPRRVRLEGSLGVEPTEGPATLTFTGIALSSGEGSLRADGAWADGGTRAKPLSLAVAAIDRALLDDVWNLLALEAEMPQLADVRQGRIVSGTLELLPIVTERRRAVDWTRSRGALTLAGLANLGEAAPALADAAGRFEFARGAAQLRLTEGTLEDLEITRARIDWPRQGGPRLQAALRGELQSPFLQGLLAGHGLEALNGAVTLDADARGDEAFADPRSWRVTARIQDASMPVSAKLPPVDKLAGTVRFADGQLRGATLEGQWLGGPLELETRRATARGPLSATVSGVAEASPLLRAVGREDDAGLVQGRFAWSGVLQRTGEEWQVTLDGNLAGVESRLPEPFDKPRARPLPLRAELRVGAGGVREFTIASGRDSVSARVGAESSNAEFRLRGVSGTWSRGAGKSAEPLLEIERLDLGEAAWVLTAAGATLPADAALRVGIGDLRHAHRGLGSMRVSVARQPEQLEFVVESAAGALHELMARGQCTREQCEGNFRFSTDRLGDLLLVDELPAEWPKDSLRASGELRWRPADARELTRALAGRFEVEARGRDAGHQLAARATLERGEIAVTSLDGVGPAPDEVFSGTGRLDLVARTYDVTLDYEKVALAAAGAVPTPARAGLARAWSALRDTAARRGWTETPPPRRVQWHGDWN